MTKKVKKLNSDRLGKRPKKGGPRIVGNPQGLARHSDSGHGCALIVLDQETIDAEGPRLSLADLLNLCARVDPRLKISMVG